MLTVKKNADSRVNKAILHRIADIPGGVTVKTADLGGTALYEGTPLKVGSNGLYEVLKTGKVVTAYTDGTSLEIAKGSHFKVGDKIAPEDASMAATITAIDKTTNTNKDVVTLAAQFGSGLAQNAKLILVTVTTNAAVQHTAVVQGAIIATDATSFKVDKGHMLAVGDYVAGSAADPMTGKEITNIDRGNDGYDTITIGAANGKALADNEVLKVVTASNGVTVKTFAVADTITKQAGSAIAIVGDNHDVVASDNLFVPAWVQAVVKESNAPTITADQKAALKGVQFI
jgi:hypothetical protein